MRGVVDSRVYKLVCDVVDGVCLPVDLLPGLLVGRALQRVQDHLLQIRVHRATVHTHHLVGGVE